MNAQAPRVLGDCFAQVGDPDILVPGDYPLLEAPQGTTADVLVDNQAMMRLFHKAPLTIESRREGNVYKYTMLFHKE